MANYFSATDECDTPVDFKSEKGKFYVRLPVGWVRLPDGFFKDEQDLVACYSEPGCTILELEENPYGD